MGAEQSEYIHSLPAMAEASTSAAPAAAPKIRHEWYQSDNEVFVSIFIRNVKKDELKVDLAARSLSLSIPLATGSEVAFDLDPLARSIDVEKSSHEVKSMKIEFKLVKQAAGVRWNKLEGDEEGSGASTATSAAATQKTPHSYPSSARQKKNWDAIAAEVQKEESAPQDDKDPNAGGDKALNELFQKLYADATDEQKRAMIKSYQESNGTSLSTSWDEVKKGKVETRPPDSMVAKKWEQ